MKYGHEILEDRYYSDYDYEDALYERAFSEGYEYAQREFASVSGIVNKIKAIPRHIRRYAHYKAEGFKALKPALKTAKTGDISHMVNGLSDEQLRMMEASGRVAKRSKFAPLKESGRDIVDAANYIKSLKG